MDIYDVKGGSSVRFLAVPKSASFITPSSVTRLSKIKTAYSGYFQVLCLCVNIQFHADVGLLIKSVAYIYLIEDSLKYLFLVIAFQNSVERLCAQSSMAKYTLFLK